MVEGAHRLSPAEHHVILFRSDGWCSWDVEFEPLVLVVGDLHFEDARGRPRPAVVDQWLRQLSI